MSSSGLHLLIVCTANQCRSPMGEVLARDLLARHGVSGIVASAGTTAVDGIEATDGAQRTVGRLGLDLSSHRSRRVTAAMVADADIVLVMERRHLIDLTNEHGAAFTASYTVGELAALASVTPRLFGEETSDWLGRLSSERTASSALAAPEIDDPIGRSLRRYRAAANLIREGLDEILWAYGRGRRRPRDD